MNEGSRWRMQIAERIAPLYAANPKVAAVLVGGFTAAMLTRLAQGGRVGFPSVMRIVGWLGQPAAIFTRAVDATRRLPSLKDKRAQPELQA